MRHCGTLQTLRQPVRCRRHTATSPCRPHAICPTRLRDKVASLPRHHRRRLHPPILIDVAKITGHQCVRGRGGAIAVLYETHWNGILRPTWEREMDLQAFRHLILAYWADGPDHHQPNTRQYQQLRNSAAAREIARANGERHLPGSYRLVPNDVYRTRFLSAPLPIGVSI